MTETEKILLLAFVDNSIAQLQSLRGAISMLTKIKEAEVTKEGTKIQENIFGQRFDAMMQGIQSGNEDGETT